jgi:S1-C subfamily serine protease
MNEKRSHDREEERVSRLLGSLPSVEAPESFEAMVRSQIAGRQTTKTSERPIFWLALKFAVPMLLLVFLGAFLIVSDDRSSNAELVPPVDSPGVASADLTVKEPSTDQLAANSRNGSTRPPQVDRNGDQKRPAPSSEEKALSQDDTTMFPPGVDPRRISGKVSAPVVLRMLGIEASCSGVGCRVSSILMNSIASRVGLEPGDIIEAVDDKRINGASTIDGSVSSLRIVRGGKRSTIILTVR